MKHVLLFPILFLRIIYREGVFSTLHPQLAVSLLFLLFEVAKLVKLIARFPGFLELRLKRRVEGKDVKSKSENNTRTGSKLSLGFTACRFLNVIEFCTTKSPKHCNFSSRRARTIFRSVSVPRDRRDNKFAKLIS